MRKMKTTMPQNKPKNKLLNRVFAIAFALIIFTWIYDASTSGIPGPETFTRGIIVLIIIVGLLIEAWKPSLDFTFHRNRKWIFMSIILFAVFVLNSVNWWIAHGFVNWLPEYGWQTTIVEWFIGSFAMDTSSLSLMFGILFLTKSTPKKSLSYKIMLIGAVLFEFFCFAAYILFGITGGSTSPDLEAYADFWGYTIFQLFFWLDFTSEIVITIGAFRLLGRRNLILIIVAFLVSFMLGKPLAFLFLK